MSEPMAGRAALHPPYEMTRGKAMATQIGENRAKKMLQNIAYILSAGAPT
jgi:hypothetical protein